MDRRAAGRQAAANGRKAEKAIGDALKALTRPFGLPVYHRNTAAEPEADRTVSYAGMSIRIEVKHTESKSLRFDAITENERRVLRHHAASGGLSLVAISHAGRLFVCEWSVWLDIVARLAGSVWAACYADNHDLPPTTRGSRVSVPLADDKRPIGLTEITKKPRHDRAGNRLNGQVWDLDPIISPYFRRWRQRLEAK